VDEVVEAGVVVAAVVLEVVVAAVAAREHQRAVVRKAQRAVAVAVVDARDAVGHAAVGELVAEQDLPAAHVGHDQPRARQSPCTA